MNELHMYRATWLLIGAFCLLVGIAYVTLGDTPEADNGVEYTYVVQRGDTLWSIAAKNIGADVDIREEIHNIKQRNRIDADLIVGQEITLVRKKSNN